MFHPLTDRFQFDSSLPHIHKQTRNGLKASGLDCNPGKAPLRILP